MNEQEMLAAVNVLVQLGLVDVVKANETEVSFRLSHSLTKPVTTPGA